MYVETWDGLYAPIGLRKPEGEGPFATIVLASGNGGGGGTIIDQVLRDIFGTSGSGSSAPSPSAGDR